MISVCVRDEVVEDLGEIAFHDLDLGHRAAVADEEIGGHRREFAACAVDVAQPLLVHDALSHTRHDAHALGDHLAETAEIDGLSADAKVRRLLDDRGPDSLPVQPMREGGSGNPCARDEYAVFVHALHANTCMYGVQVFYLSKVVY